ncbi:hypothetical protein KCU99_g307, partial [Aureobasidium melanogenum]
MLALLRNLADFVIGGCAERMTAFATEISLPTLSGRYAEQRLLFSRGDLDLFLTLGRQDLCLVSEDGNFLSREDDSCQFSPSFTQLYQNTRLVSLCHHMYHIYICSKPLVSVVIDDGTTAEMNLRSITHLRYPKDRGTVWYLADLGMAMTERHSCECGEPQIIDTSIGTVRFLEEYESSVSRAT